MYKGELNLPAPFVIILGVPIDSRQPSTRWKQLVSVRPPQHRLIYTKG